MKKIFIFLILILLIGNNSYALDDISNDIKSPVFLNTTSIDKPPNRFLDRLLVRFSDNGEQLDVSVYFETFSIHSNATDMNERHNTKGFCVGILCYITYHNSIWRQSESVFLNLRILDKKHIVTGFRVGFVTGYDPDLIFYFMPYWGLGYKQFWVEHTVLPSPNFDGHYIMITMLKFDIFRRNF